MKPNMTNVGHGKQYPDPAEAVRAESGTYTDNVGDGAVADRLPTKSLPLATRQPPFTVRSTPSGSR